MSKQIRFSFHLQSFLAGAVSAGILFGAASAGAIDLGGMFKAGNSLVHVKQNLDGDVRSLSGDAKTLFGDKDNLLQIKDQLVKLAAQTQAQIDSINKLVGTVEGHVKTTEGDIATTSRHVGEIDDVRKTLEGG